MINKSKYSKITEDVLQNYSRLLDKYSPSSHMIDNVVIDGNFLESFDLLNFPNHRRKIEIKSNNSFKFATPKKIKKKQKEHNSCGTQTNEIVQKKQNNNTNKSLIHDVLLNDIRDIEKEFKALFPEEDNYFKKGNEEKKETNTEDEVINFFIISSDEEAFNNSIKVINEKEKQKISLDEIQIKKEVNEEELIDPDVEVIATPIIRKKKKRKRESLSIGTFKKEEYNPPATRQKIEKENKGKKKKKFSSENVNECSACLLKIEKKSGSYCLSCGHIYHKACLWNIIRARKIPNKCSLCSIPLSKDEINEIQNKIV